MRYITLSNLYNACAPETDMVRYRQGVVKLLNSLSREPDVLKMRTIDQEQTIIAFNLDDLGWTEADWNRIISAYPYAMKPDATVYQTVATLTNTPLAWVRGDWFAFTASRPPLYYDLLKLPATFAELEKQENVDIKSDIEKFLAQARRLPAFGCLQAQPADRAARHLDRLFLDLLRFQGRQAGAEPVRASARPGWRRRLQA